MENGYYNEDYLFDDEFTTFVPAVRNLPDSLDAVLSSIDLDALESALHPTRRFPDLKTNVSLRSERDFWDLVRADRLSAPHALGALRWTVRDTVSLIDTVITSRRAGRRPPGIARAAAVCEKIRRGLRRRGIDSRPLDGSPTSATQEVIQSTTRLRDAYDIMRRDRGTTSVTYEGTRILLTAYGVFVTTQEVGGTARGFFGPLSFILAVLNACENLWRTALAFEVVVQLPTCTLQRVIEVQRWQRDTIMRYGVGGYTVAKAPEAMFKAQISGAGGGDIPGIPTCLDNMAEKYIQKERDLGLGPGEEALTERLRRIVRVATSPREAYEMFGSYHFAGYPILNPVKCGQSSREAASRPDDTRADSAIQATDLFCHLFLKNYLQVEGKYPPMTFSGSAPRQGLQALHRSGCLTILDDSYPLSDWAHVVLGKVYDFEFMPDYSTLMEDKACFEGVDLRQQRYSSGRLPVEKTRLLAAILDEPGFSSEELMYKYSTHTLPERTRGARKVAKEKEYKVNSEGGGARLYVTQTWEFRWCAALLNYNIKAGIFQHFPYTSMAMKQHELHNLLSISTRRGRGEVTVCIDVDYSSWNTRFLQGWMRLFGVRLNQLYGTPGYYGQIHDHFSRFEFGVHALKMKVISLEEARLREERISNNTTWYNDATGNEGIAQREWTCATSVMFYRALLGTQHRFRIIGQGDNQLVVLVLVGVPDGEIGNEISRIMGRVERDSTDLNHTSKPEEFTYSMSMGMYGKEVFSNGVQLPQVSKAAARISPSNSETLPTIEEAIGGIMSGALSCARRSDNPLAVYKLGLYHLEMFITRLLNGVTNYPTELVDVARPLLQHATALEVIALVPSQLGGFPVVSWSGFLWTSDCDPLSQVLAELQVLGVFPLPAALLRMLDEDQWYQENPAPETLIDNPFGLPLRIQAGAAGVMHDAVASHISRARNQDVAELVGLSRTSIGPLRQTLASQRPFFPAIVSDMLEFSSVGRAEKLVQKYKTAGSLIGSVIDGGLQRDVSHRSLLRLESVVRWLLAILERAASGVPVGWMQQPSHELSSRLRLRWGFGENMIQGLDTVSPLDYDLRRDAGPGVVGFVPGGSSLTVVGPYQAWTGSKTLEIRSESNYEVEENAGVPDLSKLVLSLTAGSIGPNLLELYDQIAGSRTGTPISRLLAILPRTIGGTPAHRYEPLGGGRRIAPVGTMTASTWVKLDTDNIPGISASPEDYQVPVQAFMSLVVWAARESIAAGLHSQGYYRLPLSSRGLPQIRDSTREIPSPPSYGLIPTLPRNPLAFAPELQVRSARPSIMGERISESHVVQHPRGPLVGIFFSELSLRPSSALSQDLGSDQSRVQADHAALCALGSRTVFLAAVDAVALSAVWAMTAIVGRQEHRHFLRAVTQNLARALTTSLRPVLLSPRFPSGWVGRQEILVHRAGEGGTVAAMAQFSHILGTRAETVTTSETEILRVFRQVVLPSSVRGHPPIVPERLAAYMLCWVWSLRAPVALFGQAKQFLAAAVREASRLSSQVPGSIIMLPALSAMDGAFRETLGRAEHYPADAFSQCSRVQLIAPGDINVVYRALRRCTRDSRDLVPPTRLRSMTIPTRGIATAATFRLSPSTRMFPETLGEQSAGRTRRQTAQDKIYRTFGLYSTAGHALQPVLEMLPESGTYLVVGTGAGGIQALLAAMGRVAHGLDLFSILPVESHGRYPILVPEAMPGYPTAYLNLMHEEGNDNWLTSDVLGRLHVDVIIIDIETGRSRTYIEVLMPILRRGWTGAIVWRNFLSVGELETLVSRLATSQGISRLQVFSLSAAPGREVCTPWCLKFYVGANCQLANDGRVLEMVEPGEVVPGDDVRTEAEAWASFTRVFSSGLIVASSLRELYDVTERMIVDEVVSRASTVGGTALHLCRCRAVLQHLSMFSDPWDAFEVLPIRRSYREITIVPDDQTVMYMIKTFGPRIHALARRYPVGQQ